MSESSPLPLFPALSIIGRRAMPVDLTVNGTRTPGNNLIHRDEIFKRIRLFGSEILNPVLHGTDATIVPVLNGALFFGTELVRLLDDASRVELMSVPARSYGRSQQSSEVIVPHETIIPEKITDRVVMIVDDILDTGQTVDTVRRLIEEHKPAQIITVFLLRKMIEAAPPNQPDYVLFEIHGSSWAYGFGMDLREKYRQLPYVCDANTSLYDRNGNPLYALSA